MSLSVIIFGLVLLVGCSNNRTPGPLDDFFVEWLDAHNEKNIVVDQRGVGIKNHDVRFKADIFKVTENGDQDFTTELEIKISIGEQKKIIEYVVGIGSTREEAQQDAFVNFALTTFHVLYKGLINPDDPHQKVKVIFVNGIKRDLLPGDIYVRSGDGKEIKGIFDVKERIEEFISRLKLSEDIHWIKIVYGQHRSKPVITAVTIDNEERPDLKNEIEAAGWPNIEQFFMFKQFILVK